jgi:type IV pilus assembly protein PilY1
MKRAIAIIQIITIVFCNTWGVRLASADDSDIFGNNIEPNVLILFDSSGSMEIDPPIPANVYNASTTYTGSYTSTRVYRRILTFYFLYATSVSGVSSSSAQASLNTAGYWIGSISGSSVQLYMGNYINFLACSSCSGSQKKIDIAKQVVTDLINNTEGVRFGVMKFNSSSSGGEMVATIGTAKSTMVTAVNGITAPILATTPLGEQLDDGGRYFKGQTLRNGSSYASPIQYSCQPNFIIMVTDGLQNGSVDARTEATNRFTQDHAAGPGTPNFTGTQNVIVHTVGFSVDDPNALPVLQQTAANGGGTYYTANNSAELEQVLQDAVRQILAATFSFATPTIPTTGTSGATRAYLASFQSNASRPFWRGYLKAYNLVNGTLPVDSTTGLPSGTPAWDAGQQLSAKSAASRTIKTYASSALQDFTTSNSAITTTLLAAASTTEKDQIINYIRGAVDYNDEDVDSNTTEERPWKLGDIFHSTPVLVSPPFLYSTDSSYNTFKTDNASRTATLLAGANDGMLHAFRESDGEELWAFIPPNLLDQLKNLKALSGNRDYYVDASPVVADVKTGGTWKTIAIFGERRGGNRYYGLNITNISSPQYLWSFSDSNLGESWSEPAIGKIRMADNTDKWVAFVGGGFDTTHTNYSGTTKTTEAFFAIDLSNGAKLWEYYNSSSSDDRQYMNFALAANPTAVDLNNDGYIDRVYIGDVGGQLWKFDVAPAGGATLSGSLINNWSGKRLFAAASSQTNPPAAGEYYPTQAIYFPPTLAYDGNYNLWIFFGTGDRFHPNNTASNRFYGIKENTSMTNGSTLTESSLTNVTSGSGTVTQGWYIALNSNEKVLAASDVFNSAVLFTTFTPTTTVACGTGGGDAKLYAVNLATGDAAINLTTGAVLTAGQSALTTAKAIGTGIPSKPIIIINQSGNSGTPYVITGTTNQQISNTQIPTVKTRRLVGWREVF